MGSFQSGCLCILGGGRQQRLVIATEGSENNDKDYLQHQEEPVGGGGVRCRVHVVVFCPHNLTVVAQFTGHTLFTGWLTGLVTSQMKEQQQW